jgi:hypothetical protein
MTNQPFWQYALAQVLGVASLVGAVFLLCVLQKRLLVAHQRGLARLRRLAEREAREADRDAAYYRGLHS